MKRPRNPRLSETRIELRISMNDLPSALVGEILSRLTARSVAMCKSVCKAWYSLISDPRFAKLHSARAKSCVLIRSQDYFKFCRSLYLLEPGDDSGFDSGYCQCTARNAGCEHCCSSARVKLKLKIPLANPRSLLDLVDSCDSDATFYLRSRSKREDLIRLASRDDHYYQVVNSCNGYIFLAGRRQIRQLYCVCNPITGEFIHPPDGLRNNGVYFFEFGLGFSPKHNQYKVVRMSCLEGGGLVAEINTLGTDSWRSLDTSGFVYAPLTHPCYLNGALYWIFWENYSKTHRVASFDFDYERLNARSIPPLPHLQRNYPKLEALDGRLFVYSWSHQTTHLDIWVLNSSDAPLHWKQLFSIDLSGQDPSYSNDYYYLVSCVDDKAVVLVNGHTEEFIYYNKLEGLRFKRPTFRGMKSRFKVICFNPSFVSLKDAVTMTPGSNIEVLNVNSMCGKIKLLEENYPLLIGKTRN